MKILIALRSPQLRLFVTNYLEASLEFSQIRQADGCAGVVEQLGAEPWDVLVLGVGLPDDGGLACLRRIKAQWFTVPVVILSVYEEPVAVKTFLAEGALGYLMTAEMLDDLLASVLSALAGEVYQSKAVRSAMKM